MLGRLILDRASEVPQAKKFKQFPLFQKQKLADLFLLLLFSVIFFIFHLFTCLHFTFYFLLFSKKFKQFPLFEKQK